MLNNRAKNLPRQPDSDSSAQTVPDPWQTPSPVQKTNTVPETWNLLTETSPLISPSGSPEAPRLANPKPASEQILLEDELKLNTSTDSSFKQQLDKALALLYWLRTLKQETSNWQMSSS